MVVVLFVGRRSYFFNLVIDVLIGEVFWNFVVGVLLDFRYVMIVFCWFVWEEYLY